MPFNINTFKSEINKFGIMKTSSFEVQITPPSEIINNDYLKSMTLRARAVSFPGRTIETREYKVYGPTQKIAMDSSFEDVSMSIILSEDMREKNYLEQWQDIAVGRYRESDGKAIYEDMDLSFYNKYIGQILITTFNELGKPVRKLKCLEAYPVNVGTVSYSWEENSVAMLDVTFTYRYHYYEQINNT